MINYWGEGWKKHVKATKGREKRKICKEKPVKPDLMVNKKRAKNHHKYQHKTTTMTTHSYTS